MRTPLERGYWVALTAAIVLRPDFSTTLGRGLARTVGTSLGVVLAGFLAIALHPSDLAVVVAIGISSLGCCATFQVSYVMFTALPTGLVVLMVGIITPGTFATALARLFDTVIGGLLALGAYALWPTWSKTRAPAPSPRFSTRSPPTSPRRSPCGPDAPRETHGPSRHSPERRAGPEPSGRRLDLTQSQALLAVISRISLTVHSLRAALEHPQLAGSILEVAPLGNALSAALGQLATRALTRARQTGNGGSATSLGASRAQRPIRRSLRCDDCTTSSSRNFPAARSSHPSSRSWTSSSTRRTRSARSSALVLRAPRSPRIVRRSPRQ